MKVQCISTKSGYHKHLKLGEWYLVEEKQVLIKPSPNEIAINHWYLNKWVFTLIMWYIMINYYLEHLLKKEIIN